MQCTPCTKCIKYIKSIQVVYARTSRYQVIIYTTRDGMRSIRDSSTLDRLINRALSSSKLYGKETLLTCWIQLTLCMDASIKNKEQGTLIQVPMTNKQD